MNSIEQLNAEKTKLLKDLEEVKNRRIEATIAGKAFNESDQMVTISERLAALDEAVYVVEKREQKEIEKQQREEQKDRAWLIAVRGSEQIKKAEAAARMLVRELSELTSIFEEMRLEQLKMHGSTDELNISNDEMRVSELIEGLFGTIYSPHTNGRRVYGRFHWTTIGVLDWSEVYKPIFMNWTYGDRKLGQSAGS